MRAAIRCLPAQITKIRGRTLLRRLVTLLRVEQALRAKNRLCGLANRDMIGQNAVFRGLTLALRWRFIGIAFVLRVG